jgi:hypothetical protein
MTAPAIAIDPYFRAAVANIPAPCADTGLALVAQAALNKLTNVAGRSAKQLGDNAIAQIQNVTGHDLVPSSYATRNKADGMNNHYGAINKTLGERVADALRRRLFPHTNLTRKQLQDALKCSAGTMDNLLGGNHDPSGRILDKLVAFFRDSFVNEIWGAHNIHCLDTRAAEKAAALRKLAEAHEELRRFG